MNREVKNTIKNTVSVYNCDEDMDHYLPISIMTLITILAKNRDDKEIATACLGAISNICFKCLNEEYTIPEKFKDMVFYGKSLIDSFGDAQHSVEKLGEEELAGIISLANDNEIIGDELLSHIHKLLINQE